MKDIIRMMVLLLPIFAPITVTARSNKFLKNHIFKTIKAENGDIIDCVDFYRQPAFDHPLLKNHTIEGALAYSYYGPYDGAMATLEFWNPHVESLDYSLGTVSVHGTGDSDYNPGEPLPRIRNTAAMGWAVHPQLFGDNKTRLFVYWTKDDEKGQGCFNLQCPGFVQISQNIYPGMVLAPTSSYDGEKFAGRFGVIQVAAEERWYVTLSGERVGYWPNAIFNNFWDCDGIFWGGVVFNGEPGGNPSPTQMGSGHFTNEGSQRSAVVADAFSIKAGGIINPIHVPSDSIVTKRNCYDFRLLDDHPDAKPGFDFLYGGPGAGSVDCE